MGTRKPKETVFEAFSITRFDVVNGEPRVQGVTTDGKVREFGIAMHRDLRDNSVGMHPFRHYTDPESQPWFGDSGVWTDEETLGDRE